MTFAAPLTFTKMEALGNDFVILDERKVQHSDRKISLTTAFIQKIANRHRGIGCDQILILEDSLKADVKIFIFNADGSRAEMCGNGMRAVALYLDNYINCHPELVSRSQKKMLKEVQGNTTLKLETDVGILKAQVISPSQIKVSMGEVRMVKSIQHDGKEGLHINMGNPHTVFFGETVDDIDLKEWGPRIENDPQFPQKTNVEFAEIIMPYQIKTRIWERGAGETLACGSGACAVVLAYWHHFGVESDRTEVVMRGGALMIFQEGSEIYQEGPARFVFEGILNPEFFHDE
ncbi:Diaminopimelate epimerase [Candidatus Bealeia paramacronuclearis]|uniref:Diaminopimelate epimerase n=1 Tax=Candidatus Bealeia paramacronuclearis TaxID=1921001 RepID=A0ABZ2C2F8_9PROT|nr:Diaminopimelate epimerase [Candidatus Bealeia paramacronuclearis]